MSSAGKNIHKPVLVNPHSPDWRIFGQNPDVCLPYFLQRCLISSALVGPNPCGYVFYVCYVVEKPLCPLKEKNIHEPDRFWISSCQSSYRSKFQYFHQAQFGYLFDTDSIYIKNPYLGDYISKTNLEK